MLGINYTHALRYVFATWANNKNVFAISENWSKLVKPGQRGGGVQIATRVHVIRGAADLG
jgi:hypothetical protein